MFQWDNSITVDAKNMNIIMIGFQNTYVIKQISCHSETFLTNVTFHFFAGAMMLRMGHVRSITQPLLCPW